MNSENKKEGFTIEIDSLIFICSVDNYIEVNFLVNKLRLMLNFQRLLKRRIGEATKT